MKLAKVNEKREVNIRKTVLAHLIVSQIAFIFVNFTKNKKNNRGAAGLNVVQTRRPRL